MKKCSAISYDIIFLDHMMPGFDGVETLKRIREINNGIYRDLPVIALTANTSQRSQGNVPPRRLYGIYSQAH